MGAEPGLSDPLPLTCSTLHTQPPSCLGKGQGRSWRSISWGSPCYPQRRRRLGQALQQPLIASAPENIKDAPTRGQGKGGAHSRPAESTLRAARCLPRNSSQGPAASQLRTEGRDRQDPQPLAGTTHGSSLTAMVTSVQGKSISRGHAHTQHRLAFGAQLPASAVLGAGGRWLEPPLPPWVSHHGLTARWAHLSARLQSSPGQQNRDAPRPPPPVGGRSSPPEKANGCAGPFYSAGNPSGQGPSPLVPPWLQRLPPELCMSELAASRHRVQLLPVVLTDLIAAGEAL